MLHNTGGLFLCLSVTKPEEIKPSGDRGWDGRLWAGFWYQPENRLFTRWALPALPLLPAPLERVGPPRSEDLRLLAVQTPSGALKDRASVAPLLTRARKDARVSAVHLHVPGPGTAPSLSRCPAEKLAAGPPLGTGRATGLQTPPQSLPSADCPAGVGGVGQVVCTPASLGTLRVKGEAYPSGCGKECHKECLLEEARGHRDSEKIPSVPGRCQARPGYPWPEGPGPSSPQAPPAP